MQPTINAIFSAIICIFGILQIADRHRTLDIATTTTEKIEERIATLEGKVR